MKTTCKYCGIVNKPHKCPFKPKYYRKDVDADKFRRSRTWTNKSLLIRELDNYRCVVCNSKGILQYCGLGVHHIEKLTQDFDKRLDDDNLITLCEECHELADNGKIDKNKLKELVKLRETTPPAV